MYWTSERPDSIVAFDIDTRRDRVVWTPSGDWYLRNLALSPDGRVLAITGGIRGKRDALFRVNADGSGYSEVASSVGEGVEWSLDGRSIFYTDTGGKLMRIPAGGGVAQFTGLTLNSRNEFVLRPPTGAQIAFRQSSPAELWKIEKLSSALTGLR
jgi:Tol biopolymer transport system component